MNRQKGQSLVEALFLVAALALVLTGGAALLVNSMNVRTKSLDRKKAIEAADTVIENLLQTKQNDPEQFWKLNAVANGAVPGHENYVYSLGFTNSANCPINNCTEAVVSVSLNQNVGDSLVFSRLIAR